MAKYVRLESDSVEAFKIKLTHEVNEHGEEVITTNLSNVVNQVNESLRWPLVTHSVSLSAGCHAFLNISDGASALNKRERLTVADGDYVVLKDRGAKKVVMVVLGGIFESSFAKAPEDLPVEPEEIPTGTDEDEIFDDTTPDTPEETENLEVTEPEETTKKPATNENNTDSPVVTN